MSGIAGIVRWDGAPAQDADLRRMAEAMRHRGPDGLARARWGGVGLAHARLALRAGRPAATQPLRSADGSLALVADARLYNRREIRQRLGEGAPPGESPSDAALLLAAYERWGEAMLQVLEGDFALAVWDARRRRLFAARDPFAVKPLFFHASADRFLFASEPKQILTQPGVRSTPDDLVVGEFLFRRFEDTRRTFYAEVRRLRPACCLVATPRGVSERRYWRPEPRPEQGPRAHREWVEGVRHALDRAVARRLDVEGPVAAELSGGMDSASLVAVAGSLRAPGAARLPLLTTITDAFPGLDCDESSYVDALLATVPFEGHRFRPLEASPLEGLEEELRRIDSPWASLQRASFRLHAAWMRERGARVLLTGLGGDELFHAEYYLRDLARRGRFLALLGETWRGSRVSWNSFGRLLLDAVRAAAPEGLRRAARRVRPPLPWRPPAWAAPEFARFFRRAPAPPPTTEGGFPSLTQEWAFRWLTYPGMTWALEALEAKAAHEGFEVRHPYLDRGLAETVLRVPLEHRRLGGHWKRLLQEAVADVLPRAVWARRRKTGFAAFDAAALARAAPALPARMGREGEAAVARYVRPRALRRLLRTGGGAGRRADGYATAAPWRIACLGLWLRGLQRPRLGSDPPAVDTVPRREYAT